MTDIVSLSRHVGGLPFGEESELRPSMFEVFPSTLPSGSAVFGAKSYAEAIKGIKYANAKVAA